MNPDLSNLKAIAMTNAAKLIAEQQAPQYGPGAAQNATIAPTLEPAWNADTALKVSKAQGYNEQASLEAQKQQLQYEADQAKQLTNPNNFKRVKNTTDGGWDFFDPTGKKISAYDYANAVGSTPQEVLKDSENPIDIGYQQDVKDLQDYINATLTKNTDYNAKKYWKAVNDDVYQKQGIELWKLTPAQVIQSFKQAYPTVYGTTNTGVRAGSLFIPAASSGEDTTTTTVGG